MTFGADDPEMAARVADEYDRHLFAPSRPGPFSLFLRSVAVAVGYTTVVLMALAFSGVLVAYATYRLVKVLWG